MEYRNGKDMQGIPWERLKYSRDQYRKMRLKHYKNYENLARSHQGFDMVRFSVVHLNTSDIGAKLFFCLLPLWLCMPIVMIVVIFFPAYKGWSWL